MRRRRKLGLRMVQVEISEEIIELLEKRGYLLGPSSDTSIGRGGDGVVIGPGPGRGLVPGALDLLGADHTVEHEAQEDHGSTVDAFL